jgi:hypothetical protein
MLADHRAMEEQMERHNPVNPKRLLHNSREDHMRLSGAGATPSMGLSQIRGGGLFNHNPFDSMMGTEVIKPIKVGKGTKKGQMRKTARRAYESPRTEAMEMGLHLGKHLHDLHGGAFHKDFAEGVLKGGAWWDFLDPNKNGVGNAFNTVKHEFVDSDSGLRQGLSKAGDAVVDAGKAVGNQFTDPNSVLRGTVLPAAAKYSAYAAPVLDVAGTAFGVPGAGEMLTAGLNAANTANTVAKNFGYGRRRRRGGSMLSQAMPIAGTNMSLGNPMMGGSMTGAYEGQGLLGMTQKHGGMVRRMVGAGVSKRAEIVKKVMKEKGCSMNEASKYVKAHGLYKK